ncbi:hypothetical protein DL95DRAFT_397283 [Leptodontidium sp. 2 PMI_412]|nr:hypothetical protein DL95DRAFT_397283 [Leptodontidium sp. 2 PMI_412]
MVRTRIEARTGARARSGPINGFLLIRPTTKRSQWTSYGCSLYGWPSIGGVIIRESCDLVELRYLGFDPLDVPVMRLENQDDEDEFCRLLKKIGGKWWTSEQRRQDVIMERWPPHRRPNREELLEVYVGWPKAGGVLVLEGDSSLISVETGMLRMVTEMEERCHLLRNKLGAVFYEDPDSYTGFEGLGPRKISHDEDDEDDEDEEDKEESNHEQAVSGQGQGRQAKDGKCVCC